VSKFQTMPRLSAEDYRLLEASILTDGIVTPIIVDEDGAIIDGHHRHEIAKKHGLFEPVELREGLSESEKTALSISLNVARRHLSREERRRIIEASLKAQPEATDREHARRTGASPTTVGAVRAELEDSGEVSKLDTRRDPRGYEQPAARPTPVAIEVEGVKVAESRHITPEPSQVQPDPDWDRVNAEQEANGLVDALLTFEAYQYGNRRRILIDDVWPLGKDAVPIPLQNLFTPEKLRTAAEGLNQLATDLENHHDQH